MEILNKIKITKGDEEYLFSLDNILDTLYSIGTLYWTSDKSFDPNNSLIGTWERIE